MPRDGGASVHVITEHEPSVPAIGNMLHVQDSVKRENRGRVYSISYEKAVPVGLVDYGHLSSSI